MGKPEGLLKISELARAAGVSPSTVKYYVREGMVDIACKTGRNMAYYSPACVERVKLIKTLQTERFYPLSVIKGLLAGGMDVREVELLDVIHKTDHADAGESMPYAEAQKRSGLGKKELAALIAAGLVTPVLEGRKKLISAADQDVMRLVERRRLAGIPVSQSIRAFSAYEAHLRTAAQEDIDSLVNEAFLSRPMGTREIVRVIRTSDETLDEFVSLRRRVINREIGSAQLDRLTAFAAALKGYAEELCALLSQSAPEEATSLRAAFKSGGEGSAGMYAKLFGMGSAGLSAALALCHRADTQFSSLGDMQGRAGMVEAALRLGFRACAPSQLSPAPTAEEREEFLRGASDEGLARGIDALIQECARAKEPFSGNAPKDIDKKPDK